MCQLTGTPSLSLPLRYLFKKKNSTVLKKKENKQGTIQAAEAANHADTTAVSTGWRKQVKADSGVNGSR